MAYDGFPLLLVFSGWNGIRAAHRRIDRPDEGWTVKHHHLVNDRHHVIHARLLMFRCAAQIAVGSHAGANRTANQAMLIQFAFYMSRINVGRILYRDLYGLKPPSLEL